MLFINRIRCGYSHNVCLSLAKGKYIGFVDSDDYISENGIEELFLCAETHLADIVLGSILHCFEDGTCQRIGDKSFNQRLYSEPISGKHLFKVLIEVGSIHLWFVAICIS